MNPSSNDLHPKTGARFVFEREDVASGGAKADSAPRYALSIYLPEGRSWAGRLRWTEEGAATVEDLEGGALRGAQAATPSPAEDDAALSWALDESLKLARVLRRDPKPRLTRWRG